MSLDTDGGNNRIIYEGTTLNPKEAEMALARFEKVLIRLLPDGHTVQLGDWGFFEQTINCAGGCLNGKSVSKKFFLNRLASFQS